MSRRRLPAHFLAATDKVVNRSVYIPTSAPAVWNALTNPSMMAQWLFDEEIVLTSEWKEGSPIVFSGTWHGVKYADKGLILKLEPGKVLRYSYLSWLSKLADIPANYSDIEFKLVSEDDGTMLVVTQSNFAMEAGYAHANYYWMLALERIRRLFTAL